MRRLVPVLALLAAVSLSTPAVAANKAFVASTSDYKKNSEMKGCLMFGSFTQMCGQKLATAFNIK